MESDQEPTTPVSTEAGNQKEVEEENITQSESSVTVVETAAEDEEQDIVQPMNVDWGGWLATAKAKVGIRLFLVGSVILVLIFFLCFANHSWFGCEV